MADYFIVTGVEPMDDLGAKLMCRNGALEPGAIEVKPAPSEQGI